MQDVRRRGEKVSQVEGCRESSVEERWVQGVLEGVRTLYIESVSGERCCTGDV